MFTAQKSRAVSGDFMAVAGYSGKARYVQTADMIDGDYASGPSVADIASETSHMFGPPKITGSVVDPSIGMGILRRRPEAPGRSFAGSGGSLFPSVVAALVLASFWLSGGHVMVGHAFGDGARPVDSALRISKVASRVDDSGIRSLLFVDGQAENSGSRPERLPALEIAVTGHDGLLTRYRLGTANRLLSPGETFAFSSRLDAPKNGVRIVAVTVKE